MQLTAARLAEFVGGDLEVQNGGEGYLFRGPIKGATIDGQTVQVEVEWMAKNDGGPNSPTSTWTKDDPRPYRASLEIYSVSESAGRIIMQSSIVGEIAVLFPPGGSKLDPSRVTGL